MTEIVIVSDPDEWRQLPGVEAVLPIYDHAWADDHDLPVDDYALLTVTRLPDRHRPGATQPLALLTAWWGDNKAVVENRRIPRPLPVPGRDWVVVRSA